jgi:hypothetical protein
VAESLADDLEVGAACETGRERFTNHAEYLSSKNEPMPLPSPLMRFCRCLSCIKLSWNASELNATSCRQVHPGPVSAR